MNELDIWNQGHSAGINLAVKMINQWCDMDCKTLAEAIKAINELKEEVTL
jgi:phosphoribosyl-AMP cyclohydrolase